MVTYVNWLLYSDGSLRPYVLVFLGASMCAAQNVETGTLPAYWQTGGPNCLELPAWQVHEYNSTFYILRESGCTHYEKPFLYLIFGTRRVLLIDTGAGNPSTWKPVNEIIAGYV